MSYMQKVSREFQVMVKPIGSICNLDCKYCYYLSKRDLYPDSSSFKMSDEETADLRGRRFPSHDLAHDLAGLVAPEVSAVEQLLNRLLDHGVGHE